MNETTVFENEQFGKIRTVAVDGETWFVLADICRALGIRDTQGALRCMDDDEKCNALIRTPGGKREMLTVNESGLFNLILGSRKPEAKQFKRWIIHEVIPAITKIGAHSVKPMSAAEIMCEEAKILVEHERQLQALKEWQTSLSVEQASVRMELSALGEKVDNLEKKFNPTVPTDWYTITSYIRLKKYGITPNDYSKLGEMASALSREKDYPMGSVPHPVYGRIKTYHSDILEEVFERYRRNHDNM